MIDKIDYAKQYLDEKGIKIFAGDKQILKFEKEFYYPKKRLETSITPSQDFIKMDEEYFITMPYKKLINDFGYGFISEEAGDRAWRTRQKKIWRVVRVSDTPNIMKPDSTRSSTQLKTPEIRYYPKLKVLRIFADNLVDIDGMKVGHGDRGEAIISLEKEEKIKPEIKDPLEYFYKKKMGYKIEREVEEREKLIIPEIPMMFTEDNYLLVLEKKKDMQRILLVSMIGKGKSFGTNSLAGRVFYEFKDKVALIDPLGIFSHISLPATEFTKDLARIGEETMPIPAIHLKMSVPHLEIENDVSFRLVHNFYDFLLRYEEFTKGIAKYDLGKAERYMNSVLEMKEKVKKIRNAKDLKDLLVERLSDGMTGEVRKEMWGMIYKWRDTFEGIFKEQFTDNLFENDYSKWEVKQGDFKFKTNPFNASIYSGLFTVLNINEAKRFPTFRNRFADLIQQFIDFQKKHKERTWIIPDEMNEFYEYKKGKGADKCSEMVIELFRQGRNINVGIIGNTQSYDGLDLDVRKNTNILLCGTINLDSERKLIARDYKLETEERDRLGDLKTFEFMAMSKDPFVFYDNLGNRYEEKRTFVGKLVPPVTKHLAPELK